MRHFLINENTQKNLKATLHQPKKKIKPGEFEVCNMKCFESGPRINQNSMGSVDPDLHPSRPKWFLKNRAKTKKLLV
jgi:hypothetical protein